MRKQRLQKRLVVLLAALAAAAVAQAPPPSTPSWAGINAYFLYACNSSIQAAALNATRAAGLRVVRVFLLSTEGGGAVAACADTPVPDVEPETVGVFDDTILQRLDDFLAAAAARGLKVGKEKETEKKMAKTIVARR